MLSWGCQYAKKRRPRVADCNVLQYVAIDKHGMNIIVPTIRDARDLVKIRTWSPLTGAPNAGG